MVSHDRDATALLVALGRDGEGDVDGMAQAVQRLDDERGYTAAVTGGWIADADESTSSLEDLKKGELFFGAPVALVILLLVFGTVVAGLVPLVLSIVSILVALALVALVAQAYDLSVFTQNMLIGMGLALGIDYALFTLSRYREERLEGREKLDATRSSMTSDDLRSLALSRIRRRRNFHVHVVAHVILCLFLILIWATSEYNNAGGWPTGFRSGRENRDWDPWIIYPLIPLHALLAVHAWVAFGRSPVGEAEIEREIERIERRS